MQIKVLHLIKSLGRGGAEMLLPETLKLHNKRQYDFHYGYFLPWKDQMVPYIKQEGAQVICFKASNNLKMLLKVNEICKYIRLHKIDVIHSHLPWAGVVARLVGKRTGVPVIYTEHNKWERYHKATFWLNKLTFKWQNVAIAVSADVEESIRSNADLAFIPLKIEASQPKVANLPASGSSEVFSKDTLKLCVDKQYLTTVLNGVNTEFFKKVPSEGVRVRQELGIPKNAPVVGTVAVFRFQKRLDVWLEIAAAILKALPDAHFLLIGDGPLRGEIEKKRVELGLESKVHMLGLQTEVKPFYSAMDVYIMSSIFEGLPIALLEAMSCSCAIVSTEAGGIKEVIEHGSSGYICGVDEPLTLATYAADLLTDKQKLQSMSEGARKRVEENFSILKMVEQLEQLYKALTQARIEK